jgi:hypothetical protein
MHQYVLPINEISALAVTTMIATGQTVAAAANIVL